MKLIGIIGHARTGKDTIAKHLELNYGFKRLAFADPLRLFVQTITREEIVDEGVEPYTDEWRECWERFRTKNPEKYRQVLQEVGMAAREIIGRDCWVNAWKTALGGLSAEDKVVVPDIRQWNEAETIRCKYLGDIWTVERPGYGTVNAHRAESNIQELLKSSRPELRVTNTGTIPHMLDLVDAHMEDNNV